MRREGRKGKYGGREEGREDEGGGVILLLCQGMPMMVIEGYCFLPMTSVETSR